MNTKQVIKLGWAGLLLILLLALCLVIPQAEAQEKVLYSFTGANGDGAEPTAGLIMDGGGNLYGTTTSGGSSTNCPYSCGTVFELVKNSDGSYTEKVLYIFTGPASDGGYPSGSLVMDGAGNLYGTTEYGGAFANCPYSCGTAFELVKNFDGSYTEKILYNFTGQTNDGENPSGGLIIDSVGNLYGTTFSGGTSNIGTLFELVKNSDGSYTEKVLYSFLGSTSGDGSNPGPGLITDSAGNFYGTTLFGGSSMNCTNGCGMAFEFVKNSDGSYSEKVLYSFSGYASGDGQLPFNGLIMDSGGNLYGTTEYGGFSTNCTGNNPYLGCGTVFELLKSSGYSEKVLYNFTGSISGDGQRPYAGLIMDSQGNLYGTTGYGGANAVGTVFELIKNFDGSYTEKILYSFVASYGEGYYPEAGLIMDATGNLFGTTYFGGLGDVGTVFKLVHSTIAATPTITWPTPAAISYGTLLSSLQLDATASYLGSPVNGTFTYNPPAGTLLSVGNQTLSVTFTPFDTTDYTTATASVLLVVNPAPPAPTPTFSLAAGTYYAPQSVTINDSVSGVTIYYTTDGSLPTTSSTMCSNPCTYNFSTTTTLHAIASGNGYSPSSSTATALYLIAANAPTFSPGSGTYTTPVTVTITDTTSGATIYYAMNALPTTSSPSCPSPCSIPISTTTTLRAMAAGNGISPSNTIVATYTFAAQDPTFSPAAGIYSNAPAVTISDATPGVTIYYTTNGSFPTIPPNALTSTCTGTCVVPAFTTSTTIRAIASGPGYSTSYTASAAYTIVANNPTFSLPSGTYKGLQPVTISDSTTTPGLMIYYTTNGAIPTTSSQSCTSPCLVNVSATSVLRAMATAPGISQSGVSFASYTIQ